MFDWLTSHSSWCYELVGNVGQQCWWSYMMNKQFVQLQRQMPNGTWSNVHTTVNDSFYYVKAMRDLKRQYPDHRVRVIDTQGRLIDMIP